MIKYTKIGRDLRYGNINIARRDRNAYESRFILEFLIWNFMRLSYKNSFVIALVK